MLSLQGLEWLEIDLRKVLLEPWEGGGEGSGGREEGGREHSGAEQSLDTGSQHQTPHKDQIPIRYGCTYKIKT